MSKLWALVEVLYVGKSLQDPAKWKNLQTVMNGGLVTVFVAAIPLLQDYIHLSESDMYDIAKAVGIIGVGINAYLTTATSEKVGFKPKTK